MVVTFITNSDFLIDVKLGLVDGYKYVEINNSIADADTSGNTHSLISYTVPILTNSVILKLKGNLGPKGTTTNPKMGRFIVKIDGATLFEENVFGRSYRLCLFIHI